MNIYSLFSSSGAGRTDDLASSFAADLAWRMGKGKETTQPGTETADPAVLEAQTRKDEELNRLENALGGTVSYMAEKFGGKAASAMTGIVYKNVGEDIITEENLGNAFLDVISFVDKNFGVDAGNGLMDHLNNGLNESMNDFFDNGLSEVFMAVPMDAPGQTGATAVDGAATNAVAGQFTDIIKMMLEEFVNTERGNSGISAPYGRNEQNRNLMGVLADVSV